MWLVSFISYLDRNTLAILAPVILHDTHLNTEQYGFIISCFSVAYMFAEPALGASAGPLGGAPRDDFRCRNLEPGRHRPRMGNRILGFRDGSRRPRKRAKAPLFPADFGPSPKPCRPRNAGADWPSPIRVDRSGR
jgi:hypothetical protein